MYYFINVQIYKVITKSHSDENVGLKGLSVPQSFRIDKYKYKYKCISISSIAEGLKRLVTQELSERKIKKKLKIFLSFLRGIT